MAARALEGPLRLFRLLLAWARLAPVLLGNPRYKPPEVGNKFAETAPLTRRGSPQCSWASVRATKAYL